MSLYIGWAIRTGCDSVLEELYQQHNGPQLGGNRFSLGHRLNMAKYLFQLFPPSLLMLREVRPSVLAISSIN